MKFLAHRPQDVADIARLGVSPEDKEFVRQYLKQLPSKGTPLEQIAEAGEVLELWKVTRP